MDREKETEIKSKINTLVQEVECQNNFPVPVEKIIIHLGYELFKFSPNEKTSDISGAVDHNQKSIYINSNDSIRRQFFTIAHEIGHVILHGKNENFIDYRRDISIGSNEKEVETNLFAANLLMPEDAFRQQWKKYKQYNDFTKIKLISSYFGVSDSAANIRANYLDLLNE